MTTTKSESLAQDKKEDRMKKYPKDKEEEKDLKKEQQQQQYKHPLSESSPSISFNSSNLTNTSKPPSTPTLHHPKEYHSMSDGDIQIVAANISHSAVNDGVVKKERPKTMTVMDIEEGEQGITNSGVSKKEGKWYKVLLGLRIVALVFCKLGLSMVAADNPKVLLRVPYWNKVYEEVYQYHLYKQQEFKYLLSVNVIGFVYSGLQVGDIVKYLITKRHTLNPKLRSYFNIAMDQVLAYLLLSASSSAATVIHYWKDDSLVISKFVEMANASIVFSFIAFVAFVSTSLVSCFILCMFN